MTYARQSTITFTAIAAMMLMITAIGCGGGKGDIAGEDSRVLLDKGDPKFPDHFLPRPKRIIKRIDKSSPALAPGGDWEPNLPNHRVREVDGEALFLPAGSSSSRRGWDGTYKGKRIGQYAFAMYALTPPAGTPDGDPSAVQLRIRPIDGKIEVGDWGRGRRGNPLFQGGGNQGESPLYTGLANFETNEWDWQEHEYNKDGPTTLQRIATANHNTTRSNRCVMIVVVGPAEDALDDDSDDDSIDDGARFGGFGGFGGGTGSGFGSWRSRIRNGSGPILAVSSISRTSGKKRPDLLSEEWDELIDASLNQLDGAAGFDGDHLAYYAGNLGLNHIRCSDGSCRADTIVEQEQGFGSDLSMALDLNGLPAVCAVDHRGHVTVLKAMDDGGGSWDGTTAYEGGSVPGPVFADVCYTPKGDELVAVNDPGDGTVLVLRKRPGRVKYSNITLKRGIVTSGSPVCLSDSSGDYVVCRTVDADGGGAVFIFRRAAGSDEWEPLTLPGLPCPVDENGQSTGVVAADLDRDGALDIVCNTPEGDVCINYSPKRGEFRSYLGSPDQGSSSFSIKSCADHTHVFGYCPGDGNLRYYNKRKFSEELLEQRSEARIPQGGNGVSENVKDIHAIWYDGVDDDCDGTGEDDYRLYLLRETTLPDAEEQLKPKPRHWTLEVRVNRWESA